MSEAEEAMMLADWVDVLSDIPKRAIDMAVRYWIRNEERRAQPASIRRRALGYIVRKETKREDEKPFSPQVVPESELERRRLMLAKVLEDFPILKRIPRGDHDAT